MKMSRGIIVAVILALAGVHAEGQKPSPAGVEGSWEGELAVSPWPVFLTIHLKVIDGALGGTIELLGRSLELSAVESNEPLLRVVMGAGPDALVLEGTVGDDRYTGRALQGGGEFPFVLHRVPHYPPPAGRLEAWKQDIGALEERFLKVDRSFSAGERMLFIERLNELREQLDELHDDEIMMHLASAVALADNAHTRLYLLRNRTELRRLPVRLWWFRDGLYVVRATPEQQKLLGCRVDRIGGTSSRHARDLVSAAFAGNPSWTDYKSTYFLTSPEALHGFGITPDREKVTFGVSGCGEARTVEISPLPLLKKSRSVEAWWDLSPLHLDADREWVHSLDRIKDKLPLYLRHPELHYWYEFLPETGLLYVQYNRSSDSPTESTKQFGERLLEAFTKHEVKGFVFDLRFNTGGNLDLAKKLMLTLQERTASMPRWVITGRATFSAGITAAASWRVAGKTMFVGEPVGDELEMWAEGGNIILPNSGLYAHFANGAHSYSMKPCPPEGACLDMSSPELGPDVPVMSTWEEYVSGRDGAMEAIGLQLRR